MSKLLAVDLGLKTGYALFDQDGKLLWSRCHNFGAAKRLRNAVPGILRSLDGLDWLILEGGGALAKIWEKEALRVGEIQIRQIQANLWREALLYPRLRRTGAQAKHNADEVARMVIKWSGAPSPTSLRHDEAEAILIGFWAALDMGWLKQPPDFIK